MCFYQKKYLGNHCYVIGEIFFFVIVILPTFIVLLILAILSFTENIAYLIALLPVTLLFLALVSLIGGLCYYVIDDNLKITSGLGIPLRKIPLDNIYKIDTVDHVKNEAQSNFWFNYLSDGENGFWKVYIRHPKTKAVAIYTETDKYLIGSDCPEKLKNIIEKYLR